MPKEENDTDRDFRHNSKTIESDFLILPSAFCVSFVSPTFAPTTKRAPRAFRQMSKAPAPRALIAGL